MKKLCCSIEEAAAALGIGRTAAYEAARVGEIPTIRIGKRLLVPIQALEDKLMRSLPDPLSDITSAELRTNFLDNDREIQMNEEYTDD